MTANHRNWQQLGDLLAQRMQELGVTSEQLYEAGLPSRTYVTSLLSGRARLKFMYVKTLAEMLEIDEAELFWTALEGTVEAEDIPYLRPFLQGLQISQRGFL